MSDEKRVSPDIPNHDPQGGPITMLEAVAYTAIIAMIAATALGWFDAMIPWTS